MAIGNAPPSAPPPRAAIRLLALAAAVLLPGLALRAETAVACDASGVRAATYEPEPRRLEILQRWEKAGGAGPPELVAGIYERDWQGHDFRNKLALTIDDCRPNATMAAELDILKRRRVKATFFIIGSAFFNAWGRPMPRAKELLDRVVSEGHVIGSHSYWHRRLDEGAYRDDPNALRRELDRNEAAVDELLGYHYPILYVRPPNGAHSTPGYELDRLLRERGQYLVNWTITSFDWYIRLKKGEPDRLTPEHVIERTVKQAREDSGGVVLVHGFPETARILDEIISDLAAARNDKGGFEFVGLDEMMRLKYEK
jgi:peptidoglycan-N-acetylglucosamine deacetylase